MTLKEELELLFKNKNSKGYSRLLSTRPELLQKVKEATNQFKPMNLSQAAYIAINGEPPKCSYGNYCLFNTFDKGYRIGCADKSCRCARESQQSKITKWHASLNQSEKDKMLEVKKNTCLEKYGYEFAMSSPELLKKVQEASMKKFGVKSNVERKEVKQKCKETNLERYGVEQPLQSAAIQQKVKDTTVARYGSMMTQARTAMFEKYDGKNPFEVEEVKQKCKESMVKRFGYQHALQSHLDANTISILESADLFKIEIAGLTIAEASVKLDVSEATITRRCISHNCRDMLVISNRSKWEFKMTETLLLLGLKEGNDFVRGNRTILSGHELDFYFPQINLAIEVGSIFWHSETNAGRGKHYHHNKWKTCKEKGITLLQYWDHEMEGHWDVIVSKIKYSIGKINGKIGARKITEIRKLELSTERDFLNKNHLQGFSADRCLTLGAFIGQDLVGVFAVAKRRNSYEITRFATDLNVVYSGLFSKMLKHAIRELNMQPNTVIFSFSDNRHGSGAVYKTTGFKKKSDSMVAYYYTKNYHSLVNRKGFTKPKIEKRFNIDISGKTEWQLMQNLGYDRIWDAGKIKWEMVV